MSSGGDEVGRTRQVEPDTVVREFTHQSESFNAAPAMRSADTLGRLLELIPAASGERWLDAACGPGLVARGLAARVGEVHGVDMTPAMVALARREAEREGAANAVADNGPSMATRTFYSGRVGLRTNPQKSGVSFFAGAGGGYAAAGGGFAAVDSGLSLGFENCYVVPVFQVSGFISQPLDARPIDVTDDTTVNGMTVYTTDTPQTTYGGVMRGGLRIGLSPSRCHAGEQIPWITVGTGITFLADSENSAALPGLGLGVQIPL